jgi:hypothetical protein
VRGANAVLQTVPDARTAGLAELRLGMPGGSGAQTWAPASLPDDSLEWFRLSHAEHFLGTTYDWMEVHLRPDGQGVLAFSLARFAADGIPLTQEGVIYEGNDYPTFGISDWVATLGYGRRAGRVRWGGSLHLLRRELDQTGYGWRGDLGLGADWQGWRADASLRGAAGSGAFWENGWSEVSPPELLVGLGWEKPLPYFYGTLRLAWQGAGIFQEEGSASQELALDTSTAAEVVLAGSRPWDDFGSWAAGSSCAAEFQLDRWVVLRGGLPSVRSLSDWTAGAGLQLRRGLSMDYAYRQHPSLDAAHRITLSVSPVLWHPEW